MAAFETAAFWAIPIGAKSRSSAHDNRKFFFNEFLLLLKNILAKTERPV
jgi:hypothetical protein